MARQDQHHSSKRTRRHHHGQKDHGAKEAKRPAKLVTTDVENEAAVENADSAWSEPMLDPRNGTYYSARQMPDGSWKYSVSGSCAGIHAPSGIQSFLNYSHMNTTSYYGTSFQPQNYGQYQQQYLSAQPTSSTDPQEKPADEQKQDTGAEDTAATSKPKQATDKTTATHGQKAATHSEGSSRHHRPHCHGKSSAHGHEAKKSDSNRREGKVDAKDKVSQWLHQPDYDDIWQRESRTYPPRVVIDIGENYPARSWGMRR
ncbi:hypothetical protein F5Y15DRAFT_35556 [Xylariaceae sp. FL0016]|nr:hypothetical protein F5Y15DRAFT_35556 [Xylariaceae sp. FL0016]